MVKVGLYARVSREEQAEGYSLDAQLRAGREYAAAQGWQIVQEFVEPGASAKTDERPAFQKMIAAAYDGQLDAIIVHKLDRFSRSVLDILLYLRSLEEHGVSFVSLSERFDFTTPIGKVVLSVLAAFAQWYIDNLAAEVRKGKRERARQGLWNSAYPWGYCRGLCSKCKESNRGECPHLGGDDQSDGQCLIAHPVEAPGYDLAVESYLTGNYTDNQIARLLNEAGYRTKRGRPFGKDTVRMILRNRFYTGVVEYRGEFFPGQHPALIGQDDWDKLQQIRARMYHAPRTGERHTSRVYPLAGLVYCGECGTRMRASTGHGRVPRAERPRYYRCPASLQGRDCTQGMTPAAEVEAQLAAWLTSFELPDDWRAEILNGLDEPQQDVDRQRARLQREWDAHKTMFALGDISQAEYLSHRARIQDALAALQPPDRPDMEAAAELLANFPTIWEAATPKEKKSLIRLMIRRVVIRDRQIKSVEPTPAFALFLKKESDCQRRKRRDSNPRSPA